MNGDRGESVDVFDPARRLSVLLVTPVPPSAHGPGGIPVVTHALISGLSARHTITLVTAVHTGQQWQRDAVDDLLAAGLEVHAVPRPQSTGRALLVRRARMSAEWAAGRPWRSVWFAEPQVQRVLDHLATKCDFDVVHIEDNSMAVFRYPPATPMVLTEHEVRRPRPTDWRQIAAWRSVGGLLAELDWKRLTAHQRRVWKRFDRVQVFTRRDADAICRLAPQVCSRVRVTPFGIDVPERSSASAVDDPQLVFVGDYSHAPNVDAAVFLARDLMPLLRGRTPAPRLVLAGPGPPAELRSLAAPDIDVPGAVPDAERLVAESTVVVAPLRLGGGMRVKVLQAMALGKPVVVTPRGIDGLDAAGEPPPVVIAEKPDAFADAVVELLASKDARDALGKRARKFAATHFTADAYARRVEATYAEVVTRRENQLAG